MHEHVQPTIQLVQEQIAALEVELSEKKRMVNSLCSLIGQQPIYPDASPAASSVRAVRPDEYYGQPLSTAMRMVLERRQLANIGPAAVNDIYQAMVDGGYNFQTKNPENAKRNLYTSLTKNTAVFHKLPNGLYGLLEWYPDAKSAKAKPNGAKAGDDSEGDEDEPFNTDETAEAALKEGEPAGGKMAAKK